MKLSQVETLVLQGAEEIRASVLGKIEHTQDAGMGALVIELRALADGYRHAAELIALRMRVEAKARRKAS